VQAVNADLNRLGVVDGDTVDAFGVTHDRLRPLRCPIRYEGGAAQWRAKRRVKLCARKWLSAKVVRLPADCLEELPLLSPVNCLPRRARRCRIGLGIREAVCPRDDR